MRPICFFDLETTGVDTKTDRIVEICIIKVLETGDRISKTRRINPGIPIPKEASEIHGIYDKDVKDEPLFEKVGKSLLEFITGCDMAGYNSNRFDVPLLHNEFQRSGLYWDLADVCLLDMNNIYKINETRHLTDAMKFYCNRDHNDAHAAEADVIATIDVFEGQKEMYDLPEDRKELETYCNYGRERVGISGHFAKDEEGNLIINFGKYKGDKATDHLDYISWMLSKDFPTDTVAICEDIMENNNDPLHF